jgi:tRNA A37 methylthiotransferase MiaB
VANNLTPAKNPKKADLVFVFTCGGFKKTEENSVYAIKKALENKNSEVIITGCLPKINPSRLEAFDVPVISPENFEEIDSLINAKMPYIQCSNVSSIIGVHDLICGNFFSRIMRKSRYLKTRCGFISRFLWSLLGINKSESVKPIRYFSEQTFILEIAKGCLGDCSYCAIKLAMPKYKSFSEKTIVDTFKEGLKKNYRDFAVIAGDIGCYGMDINSNIAKLLSRLVAVKGNYRLLLIDLNARWFVEYYDELLAVIMKNSSKISNMIIPIQSGSDRILKLMNRRYEISEVKKCLLDLKKKVPNLQVETHIMVGFPGETEEDFQRSLDLVREIPFLRIETYPFEERPNTAAFDMTGKVSQEIIKKRVKKLKAEVKAAGMN